MVFSSSLFLVYFLPVFLLLYYSCSRKYKNILLVVASIIFYSWGAPRFIFVILGTTLLDFFLVREIHRSADKDRRKIFLLISLMTNLGLLFYFKYSGFFLETITQILSPFGMEVSPAVKIILPIGISFYTFETITYVVDVYRGIHAPQKSFREYLLYIIFFPKLIAGPIVRYHEIANQLTDRFDSDTFSERLLGFRRFCIGLAKKVIIANAMGEILVHTDMRGPEDLSAGIAWISAFAYAFQIYFDFSGYSDMALGLGKMLGFRLPENFNNPYIANSITDFWRRWHITLGNWMRNYLYIPLGGNRVSLDRMYINLWLVFLLSGLWHGASWNFLIWGAWHGMFLVLERAFLLKFYERVPNIFRILITFFIVIVGWTFFRIESLPKLWYTLKAMFGAGISDAVMGLSPEFAIPFMLAVFFSWFCLLPFGKKIQDIVFKEKMNYRLQLAGSITGLLLFIISLAMITGSGFNPFIYYRF